MDNHLLRDTSEIPKMRALITCLPGGSTVADFEEMIQLQSVQKTTRLWMDKEVLIAFAYVDDYNNLCFEISPDFSEEVLEREIVDWGVECIKERSGSSQEEATLDSYCSASNRLRISILERTGFIPQTIRSLHFTRLLSKPIHPYPLPDGYSFRITNGEDEIDQLVELHRAAFESDSMTVEYRRAIMAGPQYSSWMDWVAVAPNGNLVAFCLGSIEDARLMTGCLDPVGVHPDYWGTGLGAAIMTMGMLEMKKRGVRSISLGTSSENITILELAEKLGFDLSSESLWYSKVIS